MGTREIIALVPCLFYYVYTFSIYVRIISYVVYVDRVAPQPVIGLGFFYICHKANNNSIRLERSCCFKVYLGGGHWCKLNIAPPYEELQMLSVFSLHLPIIIHHRFTLETSLYPLPRSAYYY
jgi:hypothetical protein